MYTAFKIKNISFFSTLFPGLILENPLIQKITSTYFQGRETQKGFLIKVPTFIKKLKELNVTVPKIEIKEFVILDECAESMDGVGVTNFEEIKHLLL